MLDKPILTFGEVLWDFFPDGRKLGGAPLNFSYYFKKNGGNPKIVSSVGRDDLGNEALEEIDGIGINTSYIQRVDKPTGIVHVSLENDGHEFSIKRNVAWEYIQYPEGKLIADSIGLYFGTVAGNSENNKSVLGRLLDDFNKRIVFLDLNLRKGFYNLNDVRELLPKATHLKLDEDEAVFLRDNKLTGGYTPVGITKNLIRNYGLEACCITLGDRGAVAGDENGIFRVNGIPAKTGGDSVGCGDAFAAIWLASLLKGMSQEESLYQANEVASKVASQRGAIVEI